MARKRSSSTPASDEAIIEAAKRQAAEDQALAEALKNRDGAPPAAQPRTTTLQEQFIDVVALIADAKKNFRLSEQTIIKTWEITLFWNIQNRQLALQEQSRGFPFSEIQGGGEEETAEGGEDAIPVPNEVLGADAPSEE